MVRVLCPRKWRVSYLPLWEEALKVSQRAREIGTRVNGPYLFAMNEALSGYVKWVCQGSVDSLERLIQATGWLEDWEMLLFSSLPYGWLADALMSAGRDDEAKFYAGKAVARTGVQDRLGEAIAYRAMAKLAQRSEPGEMESPDHYLRLAMNSAEVRGSRHENAVTRMHQAEYLIDTDRHEQSAALLREARLAFQDMSMVWHDALARNLLRGLAGPDGS